METKQKKNGGQWIVIFGYMMIGAACGILFLQYMDHSTQKGTTAAGTVLSMLLMVLCMYVSLLVHIVIHEAGHLVFGLLTGYRFNSFRIANLMWIKENDRIRFRKMSLAGTGGQCLMSPPDMTDGRIPVMLYNYGGAIINAVTGIICAALAFLLPVYSLGWVILMLSALIGIAYALMNGLPFKMGAVNNDGRNALDMRNNKEAMRAFWIEMKSNEYSSKGVRLKDMPEEWFLVPSDESMKNGMVATLGVFACNRLFDEHRFAEADELMARLLSLDSGIVGLYRQLLICDRMYIELITQNRSDEIEKMRTKEQVKLMKAMKNYPSVLRTEYAYALLSQRDREKAAGILKDFEDQAGRFPYPGEIEAEREFITIAEGKYSESA